MTSFFAFILMCPKMCGHLGVSNHVIFVWTCPHFSRQSLCIEVIFVFKGFFFWATRVLSALAAHWKYISFYNYMILYSSVAVSHTALATQPALLWPLCCNLNGFSLCPTALHRNPILNCWVFHVFFIFYFCHPLHPLCCLGQGGIVWCLMLIQEKP